LPSGDYNSYKGKSKTMQATMQMSQEAVQAHMMQQWYASVMMQQQVMQAQMMQAQMMQQQQKNRPAKQHQQKQRANVKPSQSRITVAAVRDVPCRLQLSALKSAIEAQLPRTEVGSMLGLWNKGMVLVGLHGEAFGEHGPKRVELDQLRDHRGRAPVIERSDKAEVRTYAASHMVNARFMYEDPTQDLPPQECAPELVARYRALASCWPARGGQPHDDNELLAYGQLLEQGGAGHWKEVALPLDPKRETEQPMQRGDAPSQRRKYVQLFVIFADADAAAAAIKSADGLRVVHNGLPVVVRLEPVQPHTISGAPRLRNPGPQVASTQPSTPRPCTSGTGGSVSSLPPSDSGDYQEPEQEECDDCPPPLLEDEEAVAM